MNKIFLPLLALLGLTAAADDLDPRIKASRAVIQEFMKTLKGELTSAIKKDGPMHAVAVCRERAPGIALKFAKAKGWTVGRTSLKLRNTKNAPDAWERSVLEQFEARKAKGEAVEAMEHSEVVKQDGKRVFRYMKAIKTGPACIRCHGSKITPELDKKIRELYPEDKATGFKPGQIRGAFTITQPM